MSPPPWWCGLLWCVWCMGGGGAGVSGFEEGDGFVVLVGRDGCVVGSVIGVAAFIFVWPAGQA